MLFALVLAYRATWHRHPSVPAQDWSMPTSLSAGPWHPLLACLGFRNMCCRCIFCLDQISTDCLSMEPLVVSVEEDDVETSHTTAEASQHQYRSCERDTLLASEAKTPHGCRNGQANSPKRHILSDLLPRDTPMDRVQTTVGHFQFGNRQVLLYLSLA